MRISCIIPTFNNSEAQIRSALESVINSSFPVWEIVVIDDGSDSNFAEMVTVQMSQLYPSTKFVFAKQANKGPSAARNFGVDLAEGNWLAFLDADDAMLPSGVLSRVDVVSNSESAALACVFSSFVWSDSGKCQIFESVHFPIKADEVGVLGKAPGGLPSYLIRRDVYLSVGGLDESLVFNEDFDLILRIISRGYEVRGVSAPGFVRSVNPCSLTRSNMRRSLSGGRAFLRKAWHHGLLSKKEVFRRYILNVLLNIKYSAVSFCENIVK